MGLGDFIGANMYPIAKQQARKRFNKILGYFIFGYKFDLKIIRDILGVGGV